MPDHYEVTISVKDKDTEVRGEYELASAKETPAEVLTEVAGRLVYNFGSNVRDVEQAGR